MAQDYKVTAVSPDPKEWSGQYGPMKTYRMKLEGVDDVVEVNKKAESPAPTRGEELYGEIQPNGQYASKFKSIRKDFAFGSARDNKTYKDNSDGMRQGMCINNAAAYISDHTTGILSEKEWAQKVHDYANELYLLGDLGKSGSQGTPQASQSTATNEDKSSPAASEDVVDNDIGDEPINLDDIPF